MAGFANWVVAQPYRAALVAAALAAIPPLWPVSAAAVVLTTLQRGVQPGLSTAAGATLIAGVYWAVLGNVMVAAELALLVFLPAVGLARTLRKSATLNVCVQLASGVAVLAVVAWFVAVPDPVGLWARGLDAAFADQLAGTPEGEELLATAPKWMTGAAALLLLLISLGGLMIGMAWHASVSSPGAFGEAFRSLRLGRTAALVALAVAVMAILGGSLVGANMLLVLLAPLTMQGLAVLHGIASIRGWTNTGMLWTAVYAGLILVSYATVPVFAAVGLVDNWLDIRGRSQRAA